MSKIDNVAHRRTRCPRCDVPLATLKAGETLLAACGKCRGVWVERTVFNRIYGRDSEARGFGAAREIRGIRSTAAQSLKCPVCYYWMDAKNFENCPELVVDVCRRHGTWLDSHEWRSVLKFVKNRKSHATSESVATNRFVAANPGATLAAAGTALTVHAPASQDRSTLERSGEWVSNLVEFADIGELGDLVIGVAEIGFSLFDGL
jgi:Zn-finger nucleic acid-binding protein